MPKSLGCEKTGLRQRKVAFLNSFRTCGVNPNIIPSAFFDWDSPITGENLLTYEADLSQRGKMTNPIRDQVESSMYRYLAFCLMASVVASIHLGWIPIFTWLLSAASLMFLFYTSTSGGE